MALVLPLAPFDEHSKTSQITVSIDISPDSSLTSIKDHVTVMRALQNGDYSNEEAIEALPHRRRPRSQRPLALQIAKAIYPDLTELQAIILYESLVKTAKSTVRRRQADRLANDLKPKTNAGGKLMVIQGPWAGQEADPVDLNGPVAIPMPVAFGQAHDFKAIFEFLSQDIPFSATKQQDSKSYSLPNNQSVGGMHGYELMWDTPMLEFEKGIVYEDGRLDLCKKVVGTVHIGSLMESLESNHQIRHFLLGNNAISTTGAKAIADFLHKYPNRMETWYVAGCHLTRQALSLLVPEMIKSSAITNLWFKRNPFGPNSSDLLAELVLRTQNLRTLDLETTELGDQGTRKFLDAIAGRPASLRHLYLNANGLGEHASASLGAYLAHKECQLESLFLGSNPIGDAGMAFIAPALLVNTTLKRLLLQSVGLTSKGVTQLAIALSEGKHTVQTLCLDASQTTTAHGQKYNYLDDNCIDALKSLIMLPQMRCLDLGRTAFTASGLEQIRDAVAHSELVFFNVYRVETTDIPTDSESEDATHTTKPIGDSCSLKVRKRLSENQVKYYPHLRGYNEFLSSEELRFLKNTSDVRKIDSMYRTRDKRLGLPMDSVWEKDDPTWKLIIEDAERWENKSMA